MKTNSNKDEDNKFTQCKYYLLSFDLFGTIYFPTLFHNNKHKTLYGAFLTLILFIIILIKITFILFHIITKDNYKVKTEKYSDTEIETSIQNFSMTICTDDTFTIQNNVKYNPVRSSNDSINDTTEAILFNISNENRECLFYNMDNLTIFDSDLKENIEYLTTSIKVNKNNTVSFFNLRFSFPLIYPSISNYDIPLQNRTKYINLNNANKNGQTIKIYLDKLQVRYKNDFFMGLIGNDETYNYTVLNSIEVDDLSVFGSSGYSFIYIYYTGWRTLYTFTAYDLDNDICAFGGFINIFFFIFNSIGKIINSIFLRKKIQRNLSIKRIKTVSTISNIILKSTNNSNKTNNLINITKKQFTKNIKNNNYVEKKYLDATQNNLINDNEINLLKNLDDEQISKFESEQFSKIIDYENIYQMFKDIILLELLSLNAENAKVFFKYRTNGINLLKLEEDMMDISLSMKDNILFDDIQQKINIIHKNLLTQNKNVSLEDKILSSSIKNEIL
jgi:hypothetical protein